LHPIYIDLQSPITFSIKHSILNKAFTNTQTSEFLETSIIPSKHFLIYIYGSNRYLTTCSYYIQLQGNEIRKFSLGASPILLVFDPYLSNTNWHAPEIGIVPFSSYKIVFPRSISHIN